MPAEVTSAAQAAFALRVPGAVTARAQPAPASSGVRDTFENGAAFLRFAADDLVVELEFTLDGELLTLAGQLSPAEGVARVEIRTPEATVVREPPGSGRFAATALPQGWFSVVCHLADRPPVATPWTQVRL
ncbi:hypothetical protein Ssi02_20140 [Sinosporangium siamense]|uniref:Uncharacterized protein n=1 Tax=Sinosporangium siamense TaxID=1367973 RepID=A0A919RDA7_9ACTN|nr:hypothetical protein Ssi02_20140 [Sinosporangium siamense]